MPRTALPAILSVVMICAAAFSPSQARTVSITLGDMDGGVNNGPGTADDVYADLAWQQAVFADGPPTWPLVGFDFARKESQVPFTFEYEVFPDEIVTAATLTLAIRGVDGNVSNDALQIDSTANTYSYGTLGWTPVSLSVVSERSVDLSNLNGNYLIPLLQDGRLNVAVKDDTLVDYARLEMTILPLLVGDLDMDGFVGIVDLNIVLNRWNTQVAAGNMILGDPSGDGFVGIDDLNVVLGNWNAGTPPGVDSTALAPEPGVLGVMLLGGLAGALRGPARYRA